MKTHSKNEGANRRMMLDNNPEETSSFPNNAPGHRWYACKICGKRYDTFQALGGHQGSHRKVNSINDANVCLLSLQIAAPSTSSMLHQCKICTKKFDTGQALGGHMRQHTKLEKDTNLTDRELLRRPTAAEEKLENDLVLEEDKAKSELVLAAKEFRLAL